MRLSALGCLGRLDPGGRLGVPISAAAADSTGLPLATARRTV
jgi:hypothetical protein